MSGIAILCSGQGSQRAGMFDLVAREPLAAPVFSAATAVLGGRDPRDLVGQGDVVIHDNEVAQVLCCTAALAIWALIGKNLPRPLIVAGYSVGEVPAWAIAGLISNEDALALVARRAELMSAATREASGLLAIVGLPAETIDGLCAAHGLSRAIVNGPTHFVLGGPAAGLDAALAEALAHGASRAIRLPVNVPAHTPALRAAAEAYAAELHSRVDGEARIPRNVRLISGFDGMPVRDIAGGLQKLAAQLATTVDWAACMDACLSAQPSCVLELGPGSALSRMVAELGSGVPVRSVADFRSVGGIRRWIDGAAQRHN